MNVWKITNVSNQDIKVACKTNSMASKGIILKPNEFCISEPQITASLDAQERRRFLEVDREFDNSKFNFEFVKSYSTKELEKNNEDSFEEAAKNAEKYINNN
jgi:hypothetical protein